MQDFFNQRYKNWFVQRGQIGKSDILKLIISFSFGIFFYF